MTHRRDRYAADKRADARASHRHAAPRLEGVVKNIGIAKILKPKKAVADSMRKAR
jgi:hypothetical protein